MTKSRVTAIFGLVLSTLLLTGCLRGPVAGGEFSVFPDGIYFEGGQG